MLKKILIGVLMMVFMASAEEALKPGQPAPDFSLQDGDGKTHRLKDYKGKIVVLYFYPKDDTPGCTAEACNFRDHYSALQNKGVVVLGVSYDDRESHRKFRKKYNLPFPLLSDKDKKVAELYGARGWFTGFMVAQRKTFLIDKDGTLLHIFNKVDTGGHTEQIMQILKKLKKLPQPAGKE